MLLEGCGLCLSWDSLPAFQLLLILLPASFSILRFSLELSTLINALGKIKDPGSQLLPAQLHSPVQAPLLFSGFLDLLSHSLLGISQLGVRGRLGTLQELNQHSYPVFPLTPQALIYCCSNIFYSLQTLLMCDICPCFRAVHVAVLGVLIFLVPSWLSRTSSYFLSKEMLPSFASVSSDP